MNEFPVYFEEERGGYLSGGVHFFCSITCRGLAPTAGYGCPIRAGEQPESDIEEGTTCETCGKILVVPSDVKTLSEPVNSSRVSPSDTPWIITTEFAEIVPFSIVKADDTGGSIADVFGDSIAEAEANAKLIVRAVNSHETLVKALRFLDNGHGHFAGCVRDLPLDPFRPCRKSCQLIREALALAESDGQ